MSLDNPHNYKFCRPKPKVDNFWLFVLLVFLTLYGGYWVNKNYESHAGEVGSWNGDIRR